MNADTSTCPKNLNSLPAFIRAQVETPGVVEHHFIRWLLQVFESNVRLAEEITEHSDMLLDPDEVGRLPGRVGSPLLSAVDFTDLSSFVSRLLDDSDDPENNPQKAVSQYLRAKLSESTRASTPDLRQVGASTGRLLEALIQDLNRILQDGPLDDAARFQGVKFSERTRELRRRKPSGDTLIRLNRLLLEDAYQGEIASRPDALLLRSNEWELDALRWLASWVSLEIDPNWLDETITQGNRDGTVQSSVRRYDKVATIIRRAAPLYRERGTKHGLETLLQEFYDWDVEIIERAWPRGMQIGISSLIESNSWLLEEPDLEQQFVVLIKPTVRSYQRLPRLGARIEADLFGGGSEGKRIDCYLGSGQQVIDQGTASRLTDTANNLRRLIDLEMPAHLRYFLAFEHLQPEPPPPKLPAMVIGVGSEIGRFWINN